MGMKVLILWPGGKWCTTSYFGSRGEFVVFECIMHYDVGKLLNTALWYWHWNNMAAFSHDLCTCWSKITVPFALVLWMRGSYILYLFIQTLASKVSTTCRQPLLYMAFSYMHAINYELYYISSTISHSEYVCIFWICIIFCLLVPCLVDSKFGNFKVLMLNKE